MEAKKIEEEQGVEIQDFQAAVAQEKPEHVPTPQNELFLVQYGTTAKVVVIAAVILAVWAVVEFVIA